MENSVFDYESLGDELAVPAEVMLKLKEEAIKEFPFDNMLMEIHVLRAVKAYAKANVRMAVIEN